MKKFSLKEICEEVNNHFKNNNIETIKDKRISSELTERRILDYISKKLLDKPFGKGNDKFFTEEHLKNLIEIRHLQLNGLSEQNIKSINNVYEKSELDIPKENNIQTNALNLIHSFMNFNHEKKEISSCSNMQKLNDNINSSNLRTYTPIYKNFKEYNLDTNIDISLKINQNDEHKIKKIELMLEEIKLVIKKYK